MAFIPRYVVLRDTGQRRILVRGDLLGRHDLQELAKRELASVLQYAADKGDYRWNSGERRFNLGLFRGMAGVGYTALRQVDPSLPNVLIFE
jgi:lantibiotic modifying enzyme